MCTGMCKELVTTALSQQYAIFQSTCRTSLYPEVDRIQWASWTITQSSLTQPRRFLLRTGLSHTAIHTRNALNGNTGNSSEGTNRLPRLVRAAQSFRISINTKLNKVKKGFPMKVLFFLIGFYCATAFATVIGQTGDWDILSAGLAVVVVEAIGALMYKTSSQILDKLKNVITMFNYWKAGLSMGLFLDAFKYEIDMSFGFWNLFDFEMDIFPWL